MARIGFLTAGMDDPDTSARILPPFRDGLRTRGYVEGRNVTIDIPRGDTLAARASDAVRRNVDVIVAVGAPAALEAYKATRAIPIVALMGDPVEIGLATGLAQSGTNVTGVSVRHAETAGKRLELVLTVVPKASRVAVLWNAANPNKAIEWKRTEAAAQQRGVTVQSIEVGADIERAFEAIAKSRAEMLIALTESITIVHRRRIADFALRHRIPAIAAYREFADAGLLMTYGPNSGEAYRHLATFVDKILKGTRPADLPIEQVSRLELVINARTAKAIGVTISPALLARADAVIQ
jgi:putative ABC transport system substrate-binding protein